MHNILYSLHIYIDHCHNIGTNKPTKRKPSTMEKKNKLNSSAKAFVPQVSLYVCITLVVLLIVLLYGLWICNVTFCMLDVIHIHQYYVYCRTV